MLGYLNHAVLLLILLVNAPVGGIAATKAYHTEENATCSGLPASEPRVHVCIDDTYYIFKLPSHDIRITQIDYQRRVHRALSGWEGFSALKDVHRPSQLAAKIWLSIPEVNPDATQSRIVFYHNNTPLFMVSAPLDLKDLQINEDNVSFFLDQGYPKSFGLKMGELLVQRKEGVSLELLRAYLHQFDVLRVEPFSGGWYAADVRLFREIQTRQDILAHPVSGFFVSAIQYNQLFEWIAWRDKVFSFVIDIR